MSLTIIMLDYTFLRGRAKKTKTACIYFDAAVASPEVQQLAEVAADALEAAKPHVERLAWHTVDAIARPVLNTLDQAPYTAEDYRQFGDAVIEGYLNKKGLV